MSQLPVAVSKYLNRILYPDRGFAYMELDERHYVVASGGELERCGVPTPILDSPIENQFRVLTGIIPVDGIPVVIQNIELSDQIFVDMHVFRYEDSQWVLVLDNTAAKSNLQSQQQTRLAEKLRLESAQIKRK